MVEKYHDIRICWLLQWGITKREALQADSSLEKKEGNSKNLLLQENFFARSEEPKTAKGYINHAFSSPLGSFESNKVQAKIRCGRVESGEN